MRPGDFAAWVGPHLPAMARLAARLTSFAERDDVVQDALTAAWRKLAQYDTTRGTPRNWLLAIVADQAGKTRHRRRRLDDEVIDQPHAGRPHTDQPADVDLERAIRRLAGRQRLAVALHYFLDLPVPEVAQIMNCAEGTVKATLSQARARLRQDLGEEFR